MSALPTRLHERDLAHRVGDIIHHHHGLRHPGEARELIDHASDIVDLTYDRIGALLEYAAILVSMCRTCGAGARPKLNGGERV